MEAPLYDDKALPLHGPDDGPIVVGGSICYPIKGAALLQENESDNIDMKGIKLYVMGYVRYSDPDQNERFMGFCREYDPPIVIGGNSRFKTVNNEDYEYED